MYSTDTPILKSKKIQYSLSKGSVLTIIMFFLFFTNRILCQEDKIKSDVTPFISGEVIFNIQNTLFLNPSVGIQYYRWENHFLGSLSPIFSVCLKAGVDIGYQKKTFFAPRTSLEFQFHEFSFRTSASYLTDKHLSDWRLSPEIGYVWWNWIYVYYGYDFNLDPRDFHTISKHKITFGMKFGKDE